MRDSHVWIIIHKPSSRPTSMDGFTHYPSKRLATNVIKQFTNSFRSEYEPRKYNLQVETVSMVEYCQKALEAKQK